MFNTTFNYNFDYSQYELKIDGSKFDVTVAWLQKFGVRFNLTSFSRYILIEIIKASDSVIDALYSKFPSTEWEDYGCDDNYNDDENEFEQFLRGWLRPRTRFSNFSTIAEVKAEYRNAAKTMHPDAGGNAEDFALLNSQYNDALDALKVYA